MYLTMWIMPNNQGILTRFSQPTQGTLTYLCRNVIVMWNSVGICPFKVGWIRKRFWQWDESGGSGFSYPNFNSVSLVCRGSPGIHIDWCIIKLSNLKAHGFLSWYCSPICLSGLSIAPLNNGKASYLYQRLAVSHTQHMASNARST